VQKKGITRYTANTILSLPNCMTTWRHSRCGYSQYSENEDGIRCVAVPIKNHTEDHSRLSISWWTMTPDR
jgi:DNA-binding IclR family transcriptional regulator